MQTRIIRNTYRGNFQERYPGKKVFGAPLMNGNNLQKHKPDLLIVSPWAYIGWDCHYPFDATVGIYPTNILNAPDIHQALRRPRGTKDHYLYITKWLPQKFEPEPFIEARDKHEGLSKLVLSYAGRMAESVREYTSRLLSNVPYHFRLIAEHRGASYIHRKSIEEHIPKLNYQGYLHKKKAAWQEELEDWYHTPEKRDFVVQSFYRIEQIPEDERLWELNSTTLENEADTKRLVTLNDCAFEDFEPFYKRYRAIERFKTQTHYSIKFWHQTNKQRLLEDERFNASLQADLLEKADAALSAYFPMSDTMLKDFIADRDRSELHLILNNADFIPLKKFIKDFFPWLKDKFPWIKDS